MQAPPGLTLTLEPQHYADPVVMAAERSAIFEKSWQLLGSEAALAAPGAYVATRLGGVDIFVLQGEDGRLRGFRNACSHRGARLLERGSGKCAQIRCPYHGWQYDTLGQLRDTPWFGEASPFDLDSLPLREIAVECWRGLVFAAIDPIGPLVAQLGDLPDELAAVPIETYRSQQKLQFSAPVNWKVYLDQFTENYHVPIVHAPDKSVHIENYTVTDRDGIVILAAPAQGMFFGGRWIWGWPNWTLTLFKGGMKTSRLEPTSPTSFDIYFEFFFDDASEGGAEARQRVIDATQAIFDDDIGAGLLVQANYAEGNARPGPLHPVLENGVAYFQSRIRAALGGENGANR